MEDSCTEEEDHCVRSAAAARGGGVALALNKKIAKPSRKPPLVISPSSSASSSLPAVAAAAAAAASGNNLRPVDKVYNIDPESFRKLVQELTGRTGSSEGGGAAAAGSGGVGSTPAKIVEVPQSLAPASPPRVTAKPSTRLQRMAPPPLPSPPDAASAAAAKGSVLQPPPPLPLLSPHLFSPLPDLTPGDNVWISPAIDPAGLAAANSQVHNSLASNPTGVAVPLNATTTSTMPAVMPTTMAAAFSAATRYQTWLPWSPPMYAMGPPPGYAPSFPPGMMTPPTAFFPATAFFGAHPGFALPADGGHASTVWRPHHSAHVDPAHPPPPSLPPQHEFTFQGATTPAPGAGRPPHRMH